MNPMAEEHTLLRAGLMVDHFQVARLLGGGAMGEVYLARDTHLGRQVALKVVHRDAVGDQDALKRFLHEARVTARFSHPHIVTIYGVGEHQGCPYVALEYLPGQTLRDRVAEERPGVKESLRIALAIAEALKEAHAHHVLHRDLKPSNVLLPRDGRLRVVDFGLAKLLEEVASPAGAPRPPAAPAPVPPSNPGMDATLPVRVAEIAAATGGMDTPFASLLEDEASRSAFRSEGRGLRGTPAFMAPEQWAERVVGSEADVWALGMILYELLTGAHPYPTRNLFELGLRICDAAPIPPVREAVPDLALGVATLVDRCLAKAPADRPTAEAVVQTLQELLVDSTGPGLATRSPFRGLLPFAERHADLFFGRDGEIAAFLERMREEAMLPVVGPSGAGKSSFVQAGIIPRLREQAHWRVLRLRPGAHPFETLASRIIASELSASRTSLGSVGSVLEPGSPNPEAGAERLEAEQRLAQELRATPTRLALRLLQLAEKAQGRVLLFVDQLEELYTLVPDEEERLLFMQALYTSADDPSGPVRTLFTLRDDFLWRLAEGSAARDALGRVTVLRPPGREQLVEILERPLAKVGYQLDSPELVGEMVSQVEGEPAALPLLQFVARQMWEQRDPEQRLLTEASYRALGGVAGALARHADSSLAALSASQVRLARTIFLRLVTPEATRRVVSKSDLLEGLGTQGELVLNRFTGARTILARKGRSEAELELAHESLITQWGRLAEWLEESREEREFLAEVEQAASLWQRRNRPTEEVWGGQALADALLRAARCEDLPEVVRRFLAAGQHRARRAQRRRRALFALGVSLLALVALAAVLVGWALRGKEREAQRQKRLAQVRGQVADDQRLEAVRQRAEAQREGARAALARGALVEARAKLRGALEDGDSPLARALWWKLGREPLTWRMSLGATLYGVDFSPAGDTVAVASMDHAIHLVDVHTRAIRVLRGHRDQVLTVTYAPDGQHLASATYSGEVRIWDLRSGDSQTLRGHATGVAQVAFSADGRLLASAGADQTVRLWDAATAEAKAVLKGHTGQVQSVAFSPDGRWLASASHDGQIRLWDVGSGAALRTLTGHRAPVQGVAFSPDGRWLASASADKTVRLWDMRQEVSPRVLSGHEDIVYRVRFRRDGRWLVSASADKTVRLWDVATGRSVAVLRGHTARVRDAAFSPDGRRLATVSWDQTVRLWRTALAPRALPEAGHRAQVNGVSFSPDGTLVATGGVDRTVRLWEVQSGRIRGVLRGPEATIWGVSFGPAGRLVAAASSDKTVRLWEVQTGRPAGVLRGHQAQVWSVAFQPRGSLLASVSSDKTVRLWDVRTGRPQRVLRGHTAIVWNVSFDGEGRRLATVGDDGTVRLWEAPDWRATAVLRGHRGAVFDVKFGAGGRLLASAGNDRSVRLWRRAGGVGPWGLMRVLGPHPGRAYSLDVDAAGRRVGVACSSGGGIIWNLHGEGTVTLRGHRAEVNGIRFSPDGRLAVTSGDDGTVRLWDTRTGRPRWRTTLLRPDLSEICTHEGWRDPRRAGPPRPPAPAAWRRAVAQARVADESADQALLCVVTADDGVELWDLRSDRRLRRVDRAGVTRVVALPDACYVLVSGEVLRIGRVKAPPRVLGRGCSALDRAGGQVLVAMGREIRIFDGRGELLGQHRADVGITAVTLAGGWLVVGFQDGGIERFPTRPGQSRRRVVFEATPSSAVASLVPGPTGTLVAGFGNGVYGLWSLSNGIRLEQRRLHGAVEHLRVRDGRLTAATSLGHHETLDLGVFHVPYCALLRRVWHKVPVVWRKGLPVRQAPPSVHGCAP